MAGVDCYDRDGQPIDLDTYVRLRTDPAYKRVASTEVGSLWVSTVWLGMDHGWGHGPPLIFETMVFDQERSGMTDLDCRRYATEAEARQGHDDTVTLLRATAADSTDDGRRDA